MSASSNPIKVAIAGVGNCAQALLEGIEYYRQNQNDERSKVRCVCVLVPAWGGGGRHDGAGSILNWSILGDGGGACGARWGKGTVVTYTKFLINFRAQPKIPHFREQGNEV